MSKLEDLEPFKEILTNVCETPPASEVSEHPESDGIGVYNSRVASVSFSLMLPERLSCRIGIGSSCNHRLEERQ